MRMHEILLENWYQQIRSLDDLVAYRDAFIANPGVDPELGQMMEMNPEIAAMDDAGVDEAEMLAAWFDHVIRELQVHSRQGSLTLYRMLAIQDVQGFIAATEAGHPLGNHWTYDDASASTSYDTGEHLPGSHDVLLTAEAPMASVDWFSTMQANFAHPYEHEVFVEGPVRLTSIQVGEGEVYRPQRASYAT